MNKEPDEEAYGSGRAGEKPRSPSPSRLLDGKSGGCGLKGVELTSGDLRRVPESGLRVERFTLTAAQKSAAGIVVAPAMKAQTEGSGK